MEEPHSFWYSVPGLVGGNPEAPALSPPPYPHLEATAQQLYWPIELPKVSFVE